MATPTGQSQPNPERIFDTLNAHQKTAALKAGIELEVFTAIGEGADTAAALARRCQASERGMRTLCDYLTILGFLTKQEQKYGLVPDAATFLDRRSPAYIGSIAGFLTTPEMFDRFRDLTAIVRKGGSLQDDRGTTEVNNPIWVEFARSMAAMQRPVAEGVAKLVNADAGEKWKVLDIAAGHGVYGVAIARHNPHAEIFAVDWPVVLEVAKENARAAKVESRYHTIPGNAFEVDFGTGYDLVLLTGFLHHFDPPAIEKLLRKVHAALAPNGRAVTVEFVPNEDRVTPATAAGFSLIMLAGTRAGDSYPMSEYDRMFRNAGFSSNELRPTPGPQSFIISRK
ncbi:MAG TPA: class I SAM-dependent methyltransferase [Candidatus Dormibacteraeota bacterium]|nr:class I SAM-dependent methyltransferase [Candidatus Dormibacteraeota bacterium]